MRSETKLSSRMSRYRHGLKRTSMGPWEWVKIAHLNLDLHLYLYWFVFVFVFWICICLSLNTVQEMIVANQQLDMIVDSNATRI